MAIGPANHLKVMIEPRHTTCVKVCTGNAWKQDMTNLRVNKPHHDHKWAHQLVSWGSKARLPWAKAARKQCKPQHENERAENCHHKSFEEGICIIRSAFHESSCSINQTSKVDELTHILNNSSLDAHYVKDGFLPLVVDVDDGGHDDAVVE